MVDTFISMTLLTTSAKTTTQNEIDIKTTETTPTIPTTVMMQVMIKIAEYLCSQMILDAFTVKNVMIVRICIVMEQHAKNPPYIVRGSNM